MSKAEELRRSRPTRLVSSASAIWSWQFRIILVGDSTVGKSALLKRFTEGSFAETSDPTVSIFFKLGNSLYKSFIKTVFYILEFDLGMANGMATYGININA